MSKKAILLGQKGHHGTFLRLFGLLCSPNLELLRHVQASNYSAQRTFQVRYQSKRYLYIMGL